MSVRSNKVLRDLLGSKARTLLVIAALAIGLIGLSTTVRARAIFTDNLDAQLLAVNAASGVLHVTSDDAAVAAIEARPDIDAASGRHITFGRIVTGDEVRPLRLLVVDELDRVAVDRLTPEVGVWPPPTGSLSIERSSINSTGLALGDVATVTDPTGQVHELTVTSTLHDSAIVSGELVDQVIFGYLDFATWQQLGHTRSFNQIAFSAGEGGLDIDELRAIATGAAEDLTNAGYLVERSIVPPPGKHVLDNVVTSLLLILGSLGAMSLLLSGFLVFNTVSAMLARQRPQIGVMKAIGASRRDVFGLYLAMVVVISVLALIVAVPIGMLASRALTQQLGSLLNINIDRFGAPAWVWLLEVGVGLVVPVIAALVPIVAGTRVTVAQAIRGSDATTPFGRGRIDRMLGRLGRMPMAVRYAARNTFRRKARLALTVAALSIAGAIVVTVLTLQTSLFATVDRVEGYWQQEVTVDLQQPSPADAVTSVVLSRGDVGSVEGRLTIPASVLDRDGGQGAAETIVLGVAPDSSFVAPQLTEGRWLEAGDFDAAVINVDVAANESHLAIGTRVGLRIAGVDLDWQVVGVSTTQLVAPGEPRPSAPIVYLPYEVLAERLGLSGQINAMAIGSRIQDPAGQQSLAEAIEADLGQAGIPVQAIETRSRTRDQVERLTEPILVLLAAMAMLFALVAALGLLGTMSLNVLERTKEFGMVRAVGATSRTVLTIVLVEGLTAAVLSWALGSILAVPLSWIMSHQVGVSFIRVPLEYRFAPLGVLVWFLIAAVIAAIASWLPARTASRLSVRDAIAYE